MAKAKRGGWRRHSTGSYGKSCSCPSGQKKSSFRVTRCRTKKGRFSRAKSCSR